MQKIEDVPYSTCVHENRGDENDQVNIDDVCKLESLLHVIFGM